VNLQIDADELRPIVAAVVAETLRAIEGLGLNERGARLAYSEAEAAALLGVNRGVLRDARLRGEITATKAGGRLAYQPEELRQYLVRNRLEAGR
jgi:hypothetical protein